MRRESIMLNTAHRVDSDVVTWERPHFESRKWPYQYHVSERFYPPDVARAILQGFIGSQRWKRVVKSFYDQWEITLLERDRSEESILVTERSSLQRVLELATSLFEEPMSRYINISAHKLVPGQGIGIHNDCVDRSGWPTHRIVVTFCTDYRDDQGGHFVVFDGADENAVCEVLRPLMNGAIAFKIGKGSYHAVSDIHGGERYSLVYSFWSVEELAKDGAKEEFNARFASTSNVV